MLRNGVRLEVQGGAGEKKTAGDANSREKSKLFHQDLFNLLGIGAENEERPQHLVC